MRKANRRTAPALIAAREEFEASALSAYWSRYPNFGRMPEDDVIALKASLKRADGDSLYVVFSYSTPIAWFEPKTGTWNVMGTKYSMTTSRHQSIVRYGVSLGH